MENSSTWPVPISVPSVPHEPSTTPSDGPPSLETLEDGSIWLYPGGGRPAELVEPAGTDFHHVRWATRGLPAVESALREVRDSQEAVVRGSRDAIDRVAQAAEHDDIALLEACGYVARLAMRRRSGLDDRVLEDAWRLLNSSLGRVRSMSVHPEANDALQRARRRWSE